MDPLVDRYIYITYNALYSIHGVYKPTTNVHITRGHHPVLIDDYMGIYDPICSWDSQSNWKIRV